MDYTEYEQKGFPVKKLILFLILFFCVLLVDDCVDRYQKEHTVYRNWISYELPERIRYEDCTATDEYMYFIHSGNRVNVAVFDLEGNFQHTLVFEDISNGLASIRTEDGQVFVRLRNGNVFGFRGEENTLKLTREEANLAGYTHDWFDEGEKRLRFDKKQLYFSEADGTATRTISFPEGIRLVRRGGKVAFPWNVIVLALVAALAGLILYWVFKKDKSPPQPNALRVDIGR